MTIEEMKKKKQELGYTYEQISDLSGVPLSTVQKLFRGETKSPRYDTITALTRLFSDSKPLASMVQESGVRYEYVPNNKKQGEYTLDDYYAIPEDHRVELIDGVIYEMNVPTTYHQLAAGELHRQFSNYIIEHNGSCTPFISPVDVQLDQDNRTMVQPDVIVICDEDKILPANVFGAPDFALEIISPSTKRKDYVLKLRKYELAGVREYWLVDPYQRVIIVYFFESETSPTIYPIDAVIPVNIYNGDLKICIERLNPRLP